MKYRIPTDKKSTYEASIRLIGKGCGTVIREILRSNLHVDGDVHFKC